MDNFLFRLLLLNENVFYVCDMGVDIVVFMGLIYVYIDFD